MEIKKARLLSKHSIINVILKFKRNVFLNKILLRIQYQRTMKLFVFKIPQH